MLVIIPARGGSKGVPGKNIKLLGGKPLIQYTIEAARAVVPDHRIIVSTDSSEIRQVVEKMGLKVPFLRPPILAEDKTTMDEVLRHALEYFEEENPTPREIMLLQPTSPFRNQHHIKEALNLYDNSMDMLISVKEAESSPYFELREENESGFLKKMFTSTVTRRQEIPEIWAINGAIYIFDTFLFKEKPFHDLERIKKYVMDDISSMDLDTPLDWKIGEVLLPHLEELRAKALKK